MRKPGELSLEQEIKLICKLLRIELEAKKCWGCHGSGKWFQNESDTCYTCQGSGVIPTGTMYLRESETYRTEEL